MEALKLAPWAVQQVVDFSRPELQSGVDLGSYMDRATGNLKDAEVRERAKVLSLLGRSHVAEVIGLQDEAMNESLVYMRAAEGSGMMSRAEFTRFWFSGTEAGQ